MGTRYLAVLRYLGVDPQIVDKEYAGDPIEDCDGVIIATPTSMHVEHISRCAGLPILCEKPITKKMGELDELLNFLDKFGGSLSMIDQYAELASYGDGPTYYNYFKHGGDGLAWDCINIIGHARGKVRLMENSAVWQCMINGKDLSIADMDGAYISMVAKWLQNPAGNESYIWNAHKKVTDYIECQK